MMELLSIHQIMVIFGEYIVFLAI